MNNKFLKNLQYILFILDLLSINTVLFVTQYFLQGLIEEDHIQYTYFGIFLNIAWIVVSLLFNVYGLNHITSFETFSKKTLHAFVYFFLFVIFYLFFLRQLAISRTFTIVVLTSIPLTLFFNRFLYLLIRYYIKKQNYLVSNIVIIGYNNLAKRLVTYLEEEGRNKRIIGFCENFENIKELSNYPILCPIEDTLVVCKEYGVSEIYSTIGPEQNPALYDLIELAEQNFIRFRLIPDFGFFINKQIHIDYINEIPILTLRKEPLEDISNRIKKRLFDIIFSSLVILFLLSWLIPLLSILIWLDSKGPVFFVQKRSGKDNKIFGCIKFRTMKTNASANEKQATKNDDRITSLGKFLRRSNLDEFPQFINVLMGSMSVIGPRPHMLKHTDTYSRLTSHYMIRHFSKPGISGWAQVNGLRGEVKNIDDIKKRVEFDVWYIENWSFWLDIRIILLTIINTFRGNKNAY